MLDARTRSPNDGELGRHEERIRHEQHDDDANRDEHVHHYSLSSGLAGMCLTITDSTALSATSSTSKSCSSIVMISPDEGRCPSASITIPPTVAASVSHFVSSAAAASSTVMLPGSRMRPSPSGSADGWA